MIDLLKNVFLMGVGITSITKEKINEFTKKISEDARVSEDEGQKVITELLEQIKNSKKNMDELVIRLTCETLTKLDVPTRAEYNDLERRVSKLQSLTQDKQVERQ